jgi:methyltransferase (TIGR00027 family)
MQPGQPSRTALAAATHRAAHQLLENGEIFADPLAVPILGEDPHAIAEEAVVDPLRRRMRMFIAVRSRFAEDALTAAVERGVRQLVVLGAGLDTYGYRSPFRERLRVFEVDHPATQLWKRERLLKAGIAVPGWLTFAPINFENQTLSSGLAAAGFDPRQQTFFTWLGVVPYLREEAIFSTLGFIASLGSRSQVVFDYSDPPETLSREMRAYHDERAGLVESLGEPWVSYFEPGVLYEKLAALGFSKIEDLGPPKIRRRFFRNDGDRQPDRGGHILLATSNASATEMASTW